MLLPWSVTIPIFLTIVAIFFLCYFRAPVIRLIDRIKRLKAGKVDLDARGQEAGTDIIKPTMADEVLRNYYTSPLVAEYTPILREGLDSLNLEGPEEREKILLDALASQAIVTIFEQIYYGIFGTQIQALQYLNAQGTEGAISEALRVFYDDGVATLPQFYAEYSFDQWLLYLESFGLLLKTGDKVAISVVGKEWLRWIIQTERSFVRDG